jgi:hypothetical protein
MNDRFATALAGPALAFGLFSFSAKGRVPFTPESGHLRRNYRCPLWAKSGHPN